LRSGHSPPRLVVWPWIRRTAPAPATRRRRAPSVALTLPQRSAWWRASTRPARRGTPSVASSR
jgi:hypothetical protein